MSFRTLITFLCFVALQHVHAQPEVGPWSTSIYFAKMTKDNLGPVFVGNFTTTHDNLFSVEAGKELCPENPFRRFLQPVFDTVEFLVNVTYYDDEVFGALYEFNPYFAFRVRNFPWDCYMRNSIAFGEGISYVTKVPYAELKNSEEEKKLLNLLVFEATFAAPAFPALELILRIHHRSGVFGLYHANNDGSNALGVGLRYRF